MSKETIRLTMAQALARYLASIQIEDEEGNLTSYVAGMWAIYGHGNVCGLGEAMASLKDADANRTFRPKGFPVYRGHNEQGMAHAAIAYAKAKMRRQIMAVTSSIGPGATNMITAAALAYVNRLPVLLLPGDIFNHRAPDPVLQQSENFTAGDLSVNDCFRNVSRYFDRITTPSQLLTALPRAMAILTDPLNCGPVTLSLPQDVQAQSYDYPLEFFKPYPLKIRRQLADPRDLSLTVDLINQAQKPLIISGGGVLYSQSEKLLSEFSNKYRIPVAETQAGKSALSWQHPFNVGSIGVLGSPASNELAREADLIIAVGTRLQDFTSGSNALFSRAKILALNVSPLDATRSDAYGVLGDAKLSLEYLLKNHITYRNVKWSNRAERLAKGWSNRVYELTTQPVIDTLPYDAEVIGAVRDSHENSPQNDVVVCAAGTLPAELHKLWRADGAGNYHVDYGYSCMGYEIAAGMGVKMARPYQESIVMIGDGSYMMMNSDIATAQMLGQKMIIVVLDNHGFGCINRLQTASGSPNYNNLLEHCVPEGGKDVHIDFAKHAQSMGAYGKKVANVKELRVEMQLARKRKGVSVLVIETTHNRTTEDGGAWWEVGIPEVSIFPAVNTAYERSLQQKELQRH